MCVSARHKGWFTRQVRCEGEPWGLRKKDEVALMQLDYTNIAGIEKARAREEYAEPWVFLLAIANTPLARATDDLGEDSLRTQE